MRSLAPWGLLPFLALPLDSWALTLGDIETNSYLNQPLDAEISLSATAEELQGLRVSLAPIAAFTSRGYEYPAVLGSVEFDIESDGAGGNIIRVTSSRPVSEIFLDLLIEIDHRTGTMTRLYTLLLDPPLFLPEEVAVEPIAAPAARDTTPSVASGSIDRQPQAETTAPAPVAPPRTAAPAPRPAAAPEGTDYTVQGGDTLWAIAERYRPGNVSTNQAMISLYEANRAAFDDNINRLRRGAILRIPPSSGFATVTAAAASAEVRRQTEAWQAGRQVEPQLRLVTPTDEADAPSSSDAAVAAQADNSGQIAELEDEVTSLEDRLANAQAEIAEQQRLIEAQSNELATLQQVAAEAEARAQAAVDATEAQSPDVEATEAPVFADEATPREQPGAADEAGQAPVTTPVAADESAGESLINRVVGFVKQPIVWGPAGGLLLLLVVLALLRRKRDDDDEITGQWQALDEDIEDEDEDDHTRTAQIPAVAPESDMLVVEGDAGGTAEVPALDEDEFEIDQPRERTGTMEMEAIDSIESADSIASVFDEPEPEPDFAPTAEAEQLADQTLSSQTVINLDQADPVAEADFHMAYGLYDQAADLLTSALASDPDNRALKLKLLEVYFVWGNKESFLEHAKAFRNDSEHTPGADWDKVVIMGKQICPDEELFADATIMTEAIDLDLESTEVAAGIDFTLEEDEPDSVDLDLGGEDAVSARKSPEEETLEIGAMTQAGLEAAMFDDDDEEDDTVLEGAAVADPDATMESPTVEMSASDADLGDVTQETPTIETPTIEAEGPSDDWLDEDSLGDTTEQPRAEAPVSRAEMTAELELDDLGLEVAGLENLPADDDELSATGVTRALTDDDEDASAFIGTEVLDPDAPTTLSPEFDIEATGSTTEVLEQPVSNFEPDELGEEEDLDLNLDEFSSALDGGDTVEQPVAASFGDIDLDVGDDVIGDDEPTGTEEASELQAQTMTEIGTKLDLARAYIDMGDPDGAKSILEEVLTEGDAGQRNEAQALIDALPAA